jgi:glycosyltransferase involved in cell wall biosynthesis
LRLAFLSPLPPAPTGIADYAADVLELLAPGHEVDCFHDQAAVEAARLPSSCGVHHADAFLERHRARPYDAAVYQMGNSPLHAFLYPLLARVPGLLVLHDLVLHHSRATTFLAAPAVRAYAEAPWDAARRDAALRSMAPYEDEVRYTYPEEAERLLAAQLGTVGDLLPYAYPLFRLPVEAARVVAVHNAFMAAAVAEEVPAADVVRIPMRAEAAPVAEAQVRELRARYGLAAGEPVVACFGLLTREKRVETVARAVARAAGALPALRLLLIGPVPDAAGLRGALEASGAAARTVTAGRVPLGELPAHLALADVVAHLRYPTARETSAALLRALAQGCPVVISDLEHQADIPGDAVARVDVTDEEGELTRALLRLFARPGERAALGARAAAFARERHSAARCRAGYEEALRRTAARPDPPRRDWPAHWLTA